MEVLGSRLSYCCRFIQYHNRYLCAYHLNKDDTAFGRGSKNYGKAEEEAQDWHARYGGFDWSSNAIPRAALKIVSNPRWALPEYSGRHVYACSCTRLTCIEACSRPSAQPHHVFTMADLLQPSLSRRPAVCAVGSHETQVKRLALARQLWHREATQQQVAECISSLSPGQHVPSLCTCSSSSYVLLTCRPQWRRHQEGCWHRGYLHTPVHKRCC